jgi:hypothetical protein
MCPIIIVIAFVIFLMLGVWLVNTFPFASIWHHHESGCGRTFRLVRVIKPGERCPVCFFRFFSKRIFQMKCEGCDRMKDERCNATYYTDVEHKLGDKFSCPISGKSVVVKDVLTDSPPPSEALTQGDVSRWREVMRKAAPPVVVTALTIPAILTLMNWMISFLSTAATTSASALAALVASVLVALVAALPGIEWGLAWVILLGIIYWMLHVSLNRSAASFSEIYREAHSAPDPTDSLRELYHLSLNARPSIVLRETVNKSRDTILKQRLIISILMIGMVAGALTCYLSVKRFEATWQLLQNMLRLGSTNIVLCVIIYYVAKFLFKLDDLFASRTRFFKGMVLSLIYGTASVLTLISLIILGESLSSSLIAAQLALGVIGEVILNCYEAITSLYWRTLGGTARVLGRRFWGWLSY